jgi:hypothetical protein
VDGEKGVQQEAPPAVFGEVPVEGVPDVFKAQGAVEVKEGCDHWFPFWSPQLAGGLLVCKLTTL